MHALGLSKAGKQRKAKMLIATTEASISEPRAKRAARKWR
jgi:hypothetical protein